ncbi:hypothetical protein DYB38_006117 [Aphanomyces astaci]|uniref:Uncharacterized protein n=1 Tax=Aphanomyces astaci TaxID=112090 RepID=A0A397EH44_APHAT|nr:hypothetical protein DYB38_006117 [Aphanomyces astaci]
MSRTSSSAITVLDGLDKDMATFLHMPLPSPSEHAMKRAFLRTRRAQCRRKAQLEVDSIRATATALASSATTAVHVETLRCASEGYSTEFASCRRSVDQALMTYLLRFYASVEAERRHLLHVQSMERAVCDAALARAKRNLHLEYDTDHGRFIITTLTFALYLESESAGQVQFRRLDATHPQGVRCRRAALDNVKPHGPLVDVYKIENHVVLERFQSVVASLPSPKVKGLFCSVPVAAIERCVAFGMTGDSNPPVFRASWYSNTSKYAQPVATAATPIQVTPAFFQTLYGGVLRED